MLKTPPTLKRRGVCAIPKGVTCPLRRDDLDGVADERPEPLRQLATNDDGRQLPLRVSSDVRLPVCIDFPICVTSASSFGSIPLMVMKAFALAPLIIPGPVTTGAAPITRGTCFSFAISAW